MMRDRYGSSGRRRRDGEGGNATTTIIETTGEMEDGDDRYDVVEGVNVGLARRMMRCRSMTEGVIYTIDPDLAEECLAELDFREKGVSRIDGISAVRRDEPVVHTPRSLRPSR